MRALRSRTSATLLVPRSNRACFSDRAFSVVALELWNVLSASIHDASSVASFKSLLKTPLFRAAFPTPVKLLYTAEWRFVWESFPEKLFINTFIIIKHLAPAFKSLIHTCIRLLHDLCP